MQANIGLFEKFCADTPNIAQRFLNAIKRFIAKIKRAFGKSYSASELERAAELWEASLNRIRRNVDKQRSSAEKQSAREEKKAAKEEKKAAKEDNTVIDARINKNADLNIGETDTEVDALGIYDGEYEGDDVSYDEDPAQDYSDGEDAGDGPYFIEDVDEENSVKDQIKKYQSTLDKMEIVARVNTPKDVKDSRKLFEWAMEQLKSSGFKTERQGFGTVIFDEKRLKNGLRYIKSPQERAAFALITKIIKRGLNIGEHSNHKGRGYQTVTFAAPIEIDGVRGNMAVVVRIEGKNYYKLHKVIMLSENFENKKRSGAERAAATLSVVDTPADTAPIDRISHNSKNVNRNSFVKGLTNEDNLNNPDTMSFIEDIEEADQEKDIKIGGVSASIVSKLKNSIPVLQNDDVAYFANGNEFSRGEKKLSQQVYEYFDNLGGKVLREGFGEIFLHTDGVDSSIAHGIGRAKAISFIAIPSVISNGRQIDYEAKWKGRNYDTYIFAAPIMIGTQKVYLAVVVTKSDKDNRFYLHEVVGVNGDLVKIKKDDVSFKSKSETNKSPLGETSPNKSISQNEPIVNPDTMSFIEDVEDEGYVTSAELEDNAKKHINTRSSNEITDMGIRKMARETKIPEADLQNLRRIYRKCRHDKADSEEFNRLIFIARGLATTSLMRHSGSDTIYYNGVSLLQKSSRCSSPFKKTQRLIRASVFFGAGEGT